jgi:hypothetical protein
LLIELTVAVGLTVMVNVVGVPLHPFADGVTVTVEVTGNTPLLLAINVPIFPLPFEPNPTSMDEVQEKPVPLIGPLKLIAAAACPLQ